MNHQDFTDTIIQLKDADLALRNQLIQNGELGNGYHEEMAKLHQHNSKILNNIIDTIGYPTIEKVGKAANEAAWLVIQHAIGQPKFMKKCAALLKNIGLKDNTSARHFAYLTDRIAVFEEKPQRYGTQFDWDENGQLNPNVFDNLEKVNERRKAIGLNTLEEQTIDIRARTKAENQSPPTDYEKRKQEFVAWKKAVGWIE